MSIQKSPQEHKLQGTYRKDRDQTRGLELDTEVVESIKPPTGLSKRNRDSFNEIVGYLCNLKIIQRQDIPTLHHAWKLLEDIHTIEKQQSSLEVDSEWTALQNVKLRSIQTYNSIMNAFLVSPKERIKALVLVAGEKKDTPPTPVERLMRSANE